MKPRISVITLGVEDLERSLAFYRDGLGLESPGVVGQEFEYGAVAFFQLEGGLMLAVWPHGSISKDTGLPILKAANPSITIGHNVASRADVDQLTEQARAAGARIVKEPAPTFYGGYGSYIADPDGYLWEFVYNPDLVIAD